MVCMTGMGLLIGEVNPFSGSAWRCCMLLERMARAPSLYSGS